MRVHRKVYIQEYRPFLSLPSLSSRGWCCHPQMVLPRLYGRPRDW